MPSFACKEQRRAEVPAWLCVANGGIIGCVDVLSRIKRLALARRIVLTRKAEDEMHADNLTEDEVIE